MKIEVCATNIQSALVAQKAGADRIELCMAIDGGGVTPSPGLIRNARRLLDIGIHALIRPREGNFCYTRTELDLMLDDIRFCRDAGLDGVVIGALDTHSDPDLPKIQAMIEAAGPLHVTFHRAFDFVRRPEQALEQLLELGVGRILSSGQAATAYEGRFFLKKMLEQAAGRIVMMPGAGINSANIREIAATTGAQDFPLPGRQKVVQPAAGADIPGLDWWYWESSEQTIREIVDFMKS